MFWLLSVVAYMLVGNVFIHWLFYTAKDKGDDFDFWQILMATIMWPYYFVFMLRSFLRHWKKG